MIVLIVIAPVLLLIMLGLIVTGEGYVWYFQERVGFKNNIFKIIKFATMLKNSPNMPGGIITLKKDHRITPLGGFLRSTKINELPQLINIIKGEMSIVGPRPVMPISFAAYPDEVKNSIYQVPPGLTGIGSIIFRDEEALITRVKNQGGDTWNFYQESIYPYKGALELWYQDHVSFYTDLMLIFLTAWVILFPKSNLPFTVFKDLPKRPEELAV